jgi:hypothetical protein
MFRLHAGVDDTENPLLSAVAEAWVAEKRTTSVTGRRLEDCEAAVALLTEVFGNKPTASFSKGDVRRFKEVL